MLWQLRGFASEDIREAFRSVHVIAQATRAEQPFFHVNVRNPEGERLTREQWEHVANGIESKIGLSGQPRAVAFHCDKDTGHEHMHVAWSRIDDETMTARPLPFFKLRLKEVCRALEVEFGITQVRNHRDTPVLAPSRDEFEQARRLGVDIHQVRETIRQCWEHADCGRAFRSALANEGLTLAKGDRRDYIVLDQEGGMHALGKRILGSRAAEIRTRLADIDRAQLPTVEQARRQLAIAPEVASQGSTHAASAEREDKLTSNAIDEERIKRSFVVAGSLTLAKMERPDAEATLEVLTRNRATFTARDIAWQLREQIGNQQERSEFTSEILKHPNVVCLNGSGSAPPRYTTREVLETEHQVLRAASALSAATGHEVSEHDRDTVLAREFHSLTVEQRAAVRHATGAEGIALIDGQAGTGKSYTINAIRQVYEQQGRTVIGLAPTNAVAHDMREEGFSRARTMHSELFAINNGRTRWNSRTVVIVDEAAMIDTRNLSMLTARAQATGAKLIFVGDDRQLSSIERGGMFGVLKEKHGAAELTEVRRQQTYGDRQASALMAQGNFRDALTRYDEKGAIHWTATQVEARATLVDQWAKDSAASPAKSRFVFAYCNQDANDLNAAIRDIRVQRGELGEGRTFQTQHGAAEFAPGYRLQFTDTDKQRGIYNGQAGTVRAIEGNAVTVALDGRGRRMVQFNAAEFDGFRHGYAGTIYKGQGRTFDQTYLYHSEHWRSSASYVALTRHREKAELFAARETAADLGELAHQIARVDERRAASHFQQPVFRRAADEVLKEMDWRRLLIDPDYRRQFAEQQACERPAIHRERGGRER
jgi:Ti-type conjugative transfer relaxase TraA